MKKTIIPLIILIVICCASMTACWPLGGIFNSDNYELHGSPDEIGEPKDFSKNGFKITLTDKFTEEKSKAGFDPYYVSLFCGVCVLKEEFTEENGLADLSLEQYINDVISNNGHTDIQPQTKGGLWYYVKDDATRRDYSYSYKGTDAFWVVQFICETRYVSVLEDTIQAFAESVEVE